MLDSNDNVVGGSPTGYWLLMRDIHVEEDSLLQVKRDLWYDIFCILGKFVLGGVVLLLVVAEQQRNAGIIAVLFIPVFNVRSCPS